MSSLFGDKVWKIF